ncbi:MAG TPA: TonB-dependent receptor [Puia sp.]|nr:TonB-dependent receptor [Puia sp.]
MKTFLLLIFSGIYFISSAQTSSKSNFSTYLGTLSGKVTDSTTGKPLPGASVYIADLKLGVVADESGNYRFANLPSGTYLVEAHAIGHSTQIKDITISEKAVLNFELSLQYTEQSAVVVTGQSKATQIKRSPIPIVTMSHADIVANLSTNIIDAISKLPGVTQLTTGPNVSKPFIRGLGFNRILTLYDGVRQEGQQWGDEHGIEVDQYGVDHAEVIKGPASLTYGSDALAGVVNLIPTPPAPEGKIQGDVQAEFQTNNGLFGGSAMMEGTKNGLEWMGRLSHKEASNYSDRADGRVYNTAFNETDATASIGLHRAFGYSHLNISLFDDLQEIPDGSRDSATRQFTKQITDSDTYRPIVSEKELHSYAITPLHQHVQLFHIYSTNNFVLGYGRLTVNLGFERSVRREFSHPQQPDIPGLFLQLNSYVYDVKYYFPSFDGWDITTGINGMYQQNTSTNGTEFIIPSFHQFDVGPFAMVKKSFGKLDLSGGIRFDSRSFTNQQMYTVSDGVDYDTPVYGKDTVGAYQAFPYYHKLFSGFSGSLGLAYVFSDKWSAKANISRGYRSPNISEISANGVHPGTGIYQVGNPDFSPEFNVQEDLGLNFNTKIAVVNFSVFYNSVTDYIFNEKILNNEGADSTRDGNTVYQFRQGRAALYGGELSIDIHPVEHLHFENSVSLVYGNLLSSPGKPITDSTRYLPDIPPMHGISELKYDFKNKDLHLVNGFVQVSAAFSGPQNRPYLADNTETATPGYTLINAGVGAGFTNKQNKLLFNIYVFANNIFDVVYQDHLSRLKYFEPYPNSPGPYHGIYNMGRNISIKLDFPL